MTSHSTLLFIPDISGFTNFVNSTEITHSRHIISELLEIIINSDQNNMKVSEVEGDAILFYKNNVPSVKDLIDQCKVTFTSFHNHLKRYETERICRCGACETATQLSLKFVIHAGNVEIIRIKNHEKLHGSDVILAHRLLKNSIQNSEYILFSENIDLQSVKKDTLQTIHQDSDNFDNLGVVRYSHISLNELHNNLPVAKSIRFPELSSGKISLRTQINQSIDKVYENFTDLEKRLEWNTQINDIIMDDKTKPNQSGLLHTCLVGNNKLNIETIGRQENNNRIIYGERLNKFKILRDVISIYSFQKQGSQTIVQAEIDFKIVSFLGKIVKPLVTNKLAKQTNRSLQQLKVSCEKQSNYLTK